MDASRLVAASVTGVGPCTGHGRGRTPQPSHSSNPAAPTAQPRAPRPPHRDEGLGKAARDRRARGGSRRTNRPSKGRQHDRHTPLNGNPTATIKMLAASDASALAFPPDHDKQPCDGGQSASVAGVTAPDPRPVHITWGSGDVDADNKVDIQIDTATGLRRRKSSYSSANDGECVEVGHVQNQTRNSGGGHHLCSAT